MRELLRDAYNAGYGHGYRNAAYDHEYGEAISDDGAGESFDLWLNEVPEVGRTLDDLERELADWSARREPSEEGALARLIDALDRGGELGVTVFIVCATAAATVITGFALIVRLMGA